MAARVIIVHLRRPKTKDQRTDPFFEFGSFGLTGCHRKNLLADQAAAGCRLGFAQGGNAGFRLVMLTPPVDVRALAFGNEATWKPGGMPLKYVAAPLLIDKDGDTDVPSLVSMIADSARETPMAKFSSAFRSRKNPLPEKVAAEVIAAWNRCVADESARAKTYWEALPYWDNDSVDRDRRSTYKERLAKARGEPGPGGKRRC
jgi:hypothetical protein